MGKRARRQARESMPASTPPPGAASSDYRDAEGNVLTLRCSLTAGTRREYADTLAGARGRAADTQEDAWQRAFELLFERLAVRWEIAGAPLERQRELLARLRIASAQERAWLRATLGEHCREHFPELAAP